MALGREIGEFSLKRTSSTYAQDGGSVRLSVNFDGTAPPFGTILGTLTARGAPGAKHGTCSWRAQAFGENVDSLFAVGEGTWHESGKHQYRIRLIDLISDGQVFAADGRFDLATRLFSGKLIEWS
jgi:hypothetical protein